MRQRETGIVMRLRFPFIEKLRTINNIFLLFFDDQRCRADFWQLDGGTCRKPVGDL